MQERPAPRTMILEDIWVKLNEICNKLDNLRTPFWMSVYMLGLRLRYTILSFFIVGWFTNLCLFSSRFRRSPVRQAQAQPLSMFVRDCTAWGDRKLYRSLLSAIILWKSPWSTTSSPGYHSGQDSRELGSVARDLVVPVCGRWIKARGVLGGEGGSWVTTGM